MPGLRDRLQAELTASMKARDEVRTAALRMALSAVSTESTAGKAARELSDGEVVGLLRREVRRREEAAEAYAGAGRGDREARERAEAAVLAEYLPAELADEELAALVAQAIAEAGATGPGQLGAVMRLVSPQVAGRAAGARVAAEVRRQLG